MTEPQPADSSMDDALQALIGGFRDEARELLCDMENALIELDRSPDDGELVSRTFRALHTLKGNGAMFGLHGLESFAHQLEHVFDQLRKGAMKVTPEIVDLTLGAKDRLLALLDPDGDTPGESRLREAILGRIARVLQGAGAQGLSPAPRDLAPPPPPPREAAEPISAALVAAFRDEARDLLTDLESALVALESSPDDGELITRAFRALHTIKGNAGMFGFPELEAFAFELESAFDHLRSRRLPVTRELIDLTLEARDRIAILLRDGDGDGDGDAERDLREQEVAMLRGIRSGAEAGGTAQTAPVAAAASAAWRIVFKPERSLFHGGTDPLPVFEELRGMGECSVTARLGAIPALEVIDPEACYLSWEIGLTTGATLQEIREAFIFVGGDRVVAITPADPPAPAANRAGPALPANAPAAPAATPLAALECGLSPCAADGAVPEPAAGDPAGSRAAAAALQRSGESTSTLRVGAHKLDKLVDLVGELVTVQARLSLLASRRPDPALLEAAEEIERLTATLRDHSLSVRMVPVAPAFGKFRRLVRDLSREIGREVEMQIDGENTELDKNVIDRLNDPIVHLLRNSIDHGIETREARLRAGKPERGTVRLSASYVGTNVVIRVEDDGSGIDAGAVRRKAVRRGLIAEGDQRSDRELRALIFLPGFSTSERVTKVSGRGVGLDVVKRAVEALRGRVSVESRNGEGTAFEIRIPLTLAIIEGLEVVLGDDHLIVPLAAVKECVELVRRPGDDGRERSLAEIRGELVPYVRLRDWFGIAGAPPDREQIVVTEADGRRVGLVVDDVIGGQQTVIKPLGRLFADVRGFSGATILGEGSVALILDVSQLVQHLEAASSDGAASV